MSRDEMHHRPRWHSLLEGRVAAEAAVLMAQLPHAANADAEGERAGHGAARIHDR